MYAQIIIDCQTNTVIESCEYCIARENCHLRIELQDKMQVTVDPPQIDAAPLIALA
jgi:hypothetical protein